MRLHKTDPNARRRGLLRCSMLAYVVEGLRGGNTAGVSEDVRDKVLLVCGDLHNLGDLALLLQNLELGRDEGRRIFVRRWSPLPEAIERQVAAAGGVLVSGKGLLDVLRVAWRGDCLIGGGQLVRNNVSLPSLALLFVGAVVSRLTGAKVSTRGLGVSRIRSGVRRWLWRGVLACCDEIVVRDEFSAAHARELGVRRPVVLRADMAFAPTSLHARRRRGGGAEAPVLLVAPCIDPGEERSIDGVAFANLVAALRETMPGLQIRLACHDPRPGMDLAAAKALIANHALEGATILDSYELEVLLEEYARTSFVVTNRLHALVFSTLHDRPAIAIDDGDPKIRAICATLQIPALPSDRASSSSELRELIDEALHFDGERRANTVKALGRLALGEA